MLIFCQNVIHCRRWQNHIFLFTYHLIYIRSHALKESNITTRKKSCFYKHISLTTSEVFISKHKTTIATIFNITPTKYHQQNPHHYRTKIQTNPVSVNLSTFTSTHIIPSRQIWEIVHDCTPTSSYTIQFMINSLCMIFPYVQGSVCTGDV